MPSTANGSIQASNPLRHDFSRIPAAIPIPNLIEVQKDSYERFLQMDLLPSERDEAGLQAVFASVFPISDFRGLSELAFVDYAIGDWECKCGYLRGLHHLRSTCSACGSTIRTDPYGPAQIPCRECGEFNDNRVTFCPKCGDPVGLKLKYDVDECQERGMTYAAPLKVTIRLTVFEKDADTGEKTIRDIKEQEVFFGEIPLMTNNGTFVISGTERVIVSQLHRSPGVFFESANRRTFFLGKIIPYRGSWVEFEYDQKNLLNVRIDRKRKFLGTVFLRALGLQTDEEILEKFYTVDRVRVKDAKLTRKVSETMLGSKLSAAIVDSDGKQVAAKGRKVTPLVLKELQKRKIDRLPATPDDFEGALFAADLADGEGEVIAEASSEVTPERLATLIEAGVEEFGVIYPERDAVGVVLAETLKKDTVKTQHEALIEIYRKLRPGDPPTIDTATQLFQGMFFDARKYDFSKVGRMKFNIKIHGAEDATPLDRRTLDADDFYSTIRYLLQTAPQHRRGRRHRSPRQPPRARRGRAARESVPHRLGPHGAGDEGKDVACTRKCRRRCRTIWSTPSR